MKNTIKKGKLHGQPSQKTRWSYWMQAIEPNSEAINKAFPDYHPQWVQISQKLTITPAMFKTLRTTLGMNKEQCAAYLRVAYRTICRWESGAIPVQFAAFELLRVIFESASFKLSHPEWDGWFISEQGRLVSPDVACSFDPGELNYFSFNKSESAILRNELILMQTRVSEAIGENTQLRKMFVAQGVVDELIAMQNTINELMARVATAKVIPFPTANEQPLEKTA
jgi:DNA-binding transcriptional regulator YiaG